MNLNNNYDGAGKEALFKINELEADVKNLYNKINALNNSISSFEQVELVYDKDSQDNSLNWGYPGGLQNVTVDNKDFSPYKYLRIYSAYVDQNLLYSGFTSYIVDLSSNIVSGYIGSDGFVSTYEMLANVTPVGTIFQRVIINSSKTSIEVYSKRWLVFEGFTFSGFKIYKIEGIK